MCEVMFVNSDAATLDIILDVFTREIFSSETILLRPFPQNSSFMF